MAPFDGTGEQPMQIFREWLARAEASEPNDPSAAALATATPAGVPSVRMVLTKGADDRGIRFFTHTISQKGQELRANPCAALCFHWKSLREQVRFEGTVRQLSEQEGEVYFRSRGRGSQIAAVVSHQSQPLASREELDRGVSDYKDHLGQAEVPVPSDWIGYLLVPRIVEFWKDGPDRLHDRMRVTRDGDGWKAQRLYP